MKKPFITIERQYGSGGSVIGKLVAEKLGINCYNRQILDMAAEEGGIDKEQLESAEETVPTSFLYSLLMSSNPTRSVEDNLPLSDRVFILESRIIKKISQNEDSFVLVGRCGSYILEEKGCFSVFIYAPHDYRVKRAVTEYGVKESKVENLIKKTDKRRETFFNVNTGKNWLDKDIYCLCLNSELGDELCADLIVKAYNEYNNKK